MSKKKLVFNPLSGNFDYITEDESQYIYNQVTPASSWTIVHNLKRFPSVVVVDSSGKVHEVSETYVSENEILIETNTPFAGKAYLT